MGIMGIVIFVATLILVFFLEMGEPERNWKCSKDMVPFTSDITKIAAVIPNMFVALAFQAVLFPIFKGIQNNNL